MNEYPYIYPLGFGNVGHIIITQVQLYKHFIFTYTLIKQHLAINNPLEFFLIFNSHVFFLISFHFCPFV